MTVTTMRKITKEMVDYLEWSTQDLQHMVFNVANSRGGGEERRYNIVGDVVDNEGFIHWYDTECDLIKSKTDKKEIPEEVRQWYSKLGSKKGKSKARTREQAQAAARARWDKAKKG